MPNLRLGVVSDLHMEFHRDNGASLAKEIPECDVLALVGDITVIQPRYMIAFDHLRKRAKHVIMVNGNHEYYGSSPDAVHKLLGEYAAKHPDFHWLRNEAVTIEGQRFVGSTLWFRPSNTVDRHREWLNDFAVIKGFSHWFPKENADSIAFLQRTVECDDIVLTHHLPSYQSVHPMYAGTPQNCFFVCDMEPLIKEKQPRYWLHGHTHSSASYSIGETRVLCNPFGYLLQEENPKFDPALMIDLGVPNGSPIAPL